MNNTVTNILLAGVGGQGILLASKLIAEAALIEGYDIKANEVHGMAQRGGSVIAQIRFGEKIYSPLVKTGTASFFMAMEIVEAIRYAKYIAPDGIAYVNTQRIIPTTVSSGLATYPDNPESMVEKSFSNFKMKDCLSIASDLGNKKCVNVIMCGWLSKDLPFKEETWQAAMKSQIKEKYQDLNRKAFEEGKKLA
jgi:indolepyruvate ferredoxin oxidoreductase, beta subunit